ncbi:hypothetical protein K438DRAFT_1990780 [Mycena galopus ATCC 62051]|nr:hypothetical protein K438DRAFT_1990780 [Mycena galopus ATCC 62051]
MLKAFSRIFRAGLLNLDFVEAIDTYNHQEIFFLMADIRFPCLKVCSIPTSANPVRFLQQHPKLSGLLIYPLDTITPPYLTLPAIHLPELEIFTGPQIAALSIIPHSRATRATIYWDLTHQPFSEFFQAIAGPHTTLFELETIVFAWEPTLLVAIMNHLPTLSSLCIRNFDPHSMAAELEALFSAMDVALESLCALTSFHVISPAGRPNRATLDLEFRTVRRWGEFAPSLCYCHLPSETDWRRIGGNVWIPISSNLATDTDTRIRTDWFTRTIIAASAAFRAEYIAILKTVGPEWVELESALENFDRNRIVSGASN